MDQEHKYNKRTEVREILSGKITPIQTSINLKAGELAFFEVETDRIADVSYTTSHTVGQARSPFIKGGILRGNTQIRSTTTHSRNSVNEKVDHGMLLFTSQRIIFLGKKAVSINYPEIISIHFPNPKKPHYPDVALAMEVRYAKMLKNESYKVYNKQAEMFFRGVMRYIRKDKSPVEEAEVDQFMNDDFIFSKKIVISINVDGSIACPQCDTKIKDFMEGKTFSLFGRGKKWRRYICPHCNRFISNALNDVEYSNL